MSDIELPYNDEHDRQLNDLIIFHVIEPLNAFSRRARRYTYAFHGTSFINILLGVSLPFLTTVEFPTKNITLSLIGTLIVLVNTLNSFFQWGQKAGKYREAAFSLTHILSIWQLDMHKARHMPDKDAAMTLMHEITNKALEDRANVLRSLADHDIQQQKSVQELLPPATK